MHCLYYYYSKDIYKYANVHREGLQYNIIIFSYTFFYYSYLCTVFFIISNFLQFLIISYLKRSKYLFIFLKYFSK